MHRPKDNPPAPEIRRWTARLKAAIVAAVATGELSGEEACRIYGLSGEELVSWQRAFAAHGPLGLRSSRLQQYRPRRLARALPEDFQ